MKLHSLLVVCLMLFVFNAPATTHYVDANGTNPVSPYTSWATAATNIQDALYYGGTVLVTNGIYQYGSYSDSGNNRVYVPINETVQSVNGPAVTTIVGYQVPGATNGSTAIRCVYLSNGTTLSGFTLTNGATQNSGTGYGGGIYCLSTSAVVTNCVITGNAAANSGGGAYSGTCINCTLSGNTAGSAGGAYSAALINCVLSGNAATSGGGSGGGGAGSSTLTNCLISGNRSAYSGSGVSGGTLVNCTVVSNTANAGVSGGTTLKNCIVYYNSPDNGGGNLTNCCTTPLPTFGANNIITNPPAFVNLAGGDYHLSPASPCINAGNNSFITNATDLDGNPRIIAGTVDMGAYEFQSPIHYVSISNTAPVSPFTNWITAATNIQDAVDVANAGDFIVVSNGIYKTGGRKVNGFALTNRVAVTKPVTVQSVNGPAVTTIQGNSPIGTSAIRCVYLTNGAALIGFTLTNGTTLNSGDVTYEMSGGGLLCESIKAVVSNCLMIGNSAWNGGGAEGGTLNGCTIMRNTASYGGGVYGYYNPAFEGSTISNLLNNCIVVSNYATSHGGGAFGSILNGCLLSSNSTGLYTGGGAAYSTLNNCLVFSNSSSAYQGGGVSYSSLTNCTLIGNHAGSYGGALFSTLDNCIIYYNSGGSSANQGSCTMNYCCITPLPGGSFNFTNAPLFVNLTNDFHLQSNSPCINSGNNAYVGTNIDFDGNPRIVGGTVDIGAYEFQTPNSILSYAWAQQYGLPTDGSADFLDSDGDGMNNWQEWKAGTIPTNAASVLKLSSPSNSVSGVTVTWQSVSGVTYYLQSGTNLSAQPAFSSIQSNLVGQAGSTSYTDGTATNSGPYFYRVGVQ
jgi:hypothetical protein